MFGTDTSRFDEVRIEHKPGQWSTLKPSDFLRIPLTERIQLLVGRKVRFFTASGAEVSPIEALKD